METATLDAVSCEISDIYLHLSQPFLEDRPACTYVCLHVPGPQDRNFDMHAVTLECYTLSMRCFFLDRFGAAVQSHRQSIFFTYIIFFALVKRQKIHLN